MKYVEIILKLPTTDADPPTEFEPSPACRRCGTEFDADQRIVKFDRSWFCPDCIAKLPDEFAAHARNAWVTIADHIAERPTQQSAATVRATLQNLAAMARGTWR